MSVLDRLRGLFSTPTAHRSIQPAKFDTGRIAKPAKDHPGWLALAAAVVIILPKLPFGNYVIYPFTILTTWFHEMGHGLTALLLGMEFDSLVLLEDGSGYALIRSLVDTSAFSHALVSAGGPLGPAIAGSLLILASQSERARRWALGTLGAVILLSTLIWVRSLIGWAVLPAMGVLILAIGWKANESISRFAVQFLGIHAAISMFGQWGYLFSSGAMIGGTHRTSDTGAMAEQLILPHWFWAGTIIAMGAAMIGASLLRVIGGNTRRPFVH